MRKRGKKACVSEKLGGAKFPVLGGELAMREVRFGLPGQEVRLWRRVSATRRSFFCVFGVAFAQGMALALLAMVALYLPDFLHDYAREGDRFLAFLGKFFLIALGLVGVASLVSAWLRQAVVFIDEEGRRLVFARRLTSETYAHDGVNFSEVSRVLYMPSKGRWGASRISIEVGDRMCVVANVRGQCEDLENLYGWLSGETQK
ncbi:MAG: hypothetical protein FWC40_04990 [Proteobacteria bacterium]|nr:hypothetical protein [Pseudomonadota bacterium]